MDIQTVIKVGKIVEDDLNHFGKTDKKCPFCGTPLTVKGNIPSYSVKCQTKDCFVYNVRGL